MEAEYKHKEEKHQYWYHGDHLGSAQLITNYQGLLHERIEYAPYGELWIEHRYETDSFALPYLFTGKELDPETNLYYYGARYLDPKRSRWISGDPAMGEYIPGAPVNDEARKRNQNLPGIGGVFNIVNLHVYHYAGNNPVKYIDPDGEYVARCGRYPGWSEDAPQAILPYADWMDKKSSLLGFSIDSAKIVMGNVTLRLWKGDYGGARKLVPEFARGSIGGIGGEIGFYDNRGNMIRSEQLESSFGLGLVNSSMQLFSKTDHSLLAEHGESSGWVTAFDPSVSMKKEDMYTVNTFTFKTVSQARRFERSLKTATGAANAYPNSGGERVRARIDEQNRKNVIVTFGLD